MSPDTAAKELKEILDNLAWVDIPELEWKAARLVLTINAPSDTQRLYERMLVKVRKNYWNSAGLLAQQLRSHVSGPDLALVQISLCLIKKGELDYAEEVLLRIMNPDFRPGLSYVKNLLLGFIRARTGNSQEAACCFLRAVDTNEGGRYNAARQHAAGVLATLGMKKEAGYLLSPKAPDKMIIMKIMKTVQEITSIGDNQVTESKNEDGTVFSLQHSPPHVANRLSVLRSRPIKKEIKNNSSSLEKKMNLCLRCEKASVCPGQLPCQSAWNRRSWYCPFGFIPTSPPTPYEG